MNCRYHEAHLTRVTFPKIVIMMVADSLEPIWHQGICKHDDWDHKV